MERKSRWPLLIGGALALVLVGVSAWQYRRWAAQEHLEKAEIAIENAEWEYARFNLDQFLQTAPDHPRAHYLMAEAMVKGDVSGNKQILERAIEHLQRIGDDSDLYLEAQLKTARLRLFSLWQPDRARTAIQAALKADPDSVEANYLQWKWLDLTNRGHLAKEHFWTVYDAADDQARPTLLREWFMSQFFTEYANPDLIRQMGFTPLNGVEDPILTRLIHFRLAEPESPLTHALFARVYVEAETKPEAALRQLEEDAKELDNEASEPLFLGTLVKAYVHAGKLEQAKQVFEQWPEEVRTGYHFQVAQALVTHLCLEDYAKAVELYRELTDSEWPGPVEWRLRNRMANCLARLGKHEEAAKQRELAEERGRLLTLDSLREQRLMLEDLSDPEKLLKIHDFYVGLGCKREAAAWRRVIDRLQDSEPPAETTSYSPVESSWRRVAFTEPMSCL